MILVTGANGFVGGALCAALANDGHPVRGAVRTRPSVSAAANLSFAAVGDVHGRTEWTEALSGVTCVVHLVALTHTADAQDPAMLELYRRTNVEGTRHLAESAARCGVRRMVFLSSIKVNGESTQERPFTEADAPRPEDAYGITKWEGEQVLQRVAAARGMEAVVLRPPLVYGAGVKGNLLRLMRLIERGIPLPFASIRNQRSLIFLGNLVEAIASCIRSPAAAGRTFLVSDGEDISTAALASRLGMALGTPARLFPVPVHLLTLGGKLLHKESEIARLTNSLRVDSSRIRSELGWQPRCSLAEGVAQMARWYREQASP